MAVGRFQVMAILQAARAFVLGLPLESAKSWGLNRAIFYAAAKKGLLGRRPSRREGIRLPTKILEKERRRELRESFAVHRLGDEYAYSVVLDGRKLFVIGEEIQTAEGFGRQVEKRFGPLFPRAWEEAVKICREADRGVLLSQRYFYESLYKPQRDDLAQRWTQMAKERGQS